MDRGWLTWSLQAVVLDTNILCPRDDFIILWHEEGHAATFCYEATGYGEDGWVELPAIRTDVEDLLDAEKERIDDAHEAATVAANDAYHAEYGSDGSPKLEEAKALLAAVALTTDIPIR